VVTHTRWQNAIPTEAARSNFVTTANAVPARKYHCIWIVNFMFIFGKKGGDQRLGIWELARPGIGTKGDVQMHKQGRGYRTGSSRLGLPVDSPLCCW